jgi:hypothetical protein
MYVNFVIWCFVSSETLEVEVNSDTQHATGTITNCILQEEFVKQMVYKEGKKVRNMSFVLTERKTAVTLVMHSLYTWRFRRWLYSRLPVDVVTTTRPLGCFQRLPMYRHDKNNKVNSNNQPSKEGMQTAPETLLNEQCPTVKRYFQRRMGQVIPHNHSVFSIHLTVTVTGWYRTRRPMRCGHFWSIVRPQLSSSHSWFVHQSSLPITSRHLVANLEKLGEKWSWLLPTNYLFHTCRVL